MQNIKNIVTKLFSKFYVNPKESITKSTTNSANSANPTNSTNATNKQFYHFKNIAYVSLKNTFALGSNLLYLFGINNYFKKMLYVGAIGTTTLITSSAVYAYGTVNTEVLEIDKIFTSSGGKYNSNKYMVSVIPNKSQKKIFVVSVSYWHLLFQDVELWSNFQSGKKYKITYFGFSIPDFGIHPKIINAIKL